MFDENTTIGEVLKTERGEEILSENGVPCVCCPMISQEMDFLTIGEVADRYDLNKQKIIDDLNKNK
jgi:hypothetical protein